MNGQRIDLFKCLKCLLPGETVEFSMMGHDGDMMGIGMRYLSPTGGIVHRLFTLDALKLASLEDEDVSEMFRREFADFRSMYSELERERL
jgi:hypothetical protein